MHEGFAEVDPFIVRAILRASLLAEDTQYLRKFTQAVAHIEQYVLAFCQGNTCRHLDEDVNVALVEFWQELGAQAADCQGAGRQQPKPQGQGDDSETQGPIQHDRISPPQPAQEARFRDLQILGFHQQGAQGRYNGQCEGQAANQGKTVGEGQRAKNPAFDPLQGKDGYQGSNDDQHREERGS